jgi:phosphoglucosamine mutase
LKYEHIFRAYDIRAIFNQEITAETVTKIGMAFGTYLGGKGRVLVGRDPRTSSEIMEQAFVSGLASTGCDVYVTGLVPIPVANFKVLKGGFDAGVYITASHNPPEYNGIRFRHGDGSGYTDENMEVRDIFLKGEFKLASWDRVGRIVQYPSETTLKEYSDFLKKRFEFKKPFKVVLDSGNGAASLAAPQLFRDLGAEVSTIHSYPDGTFPGRPSEPNDRTLTDLKAAVVSMGADFGVGYDGDSDRCAFVDDQGRTCQTEKIGIIISRDILDREGPGNIIANVECSKIVEEEIPKSGGTVQRVRVGDVFVAEAIKEHSALFAMETSAHYFMPEFYIFDDPMAVSLRLGEILSRSEKKLSELMDEIPSYPKMAEKFSCPDGIKFQVMDRIIENLKAKGASLDLTDGARVIFEDGWALLRPSNTTPLIRCTVEADNDARVEELLKEMKEEFEEAMRDVES